MRDLYTMSAAHAVLFGYVPYPRNLSKRRMSLAMAMDRMMTKDFDISRATLRENIHLYTMLLVDKPADFMLAQTQLWELAIKDNPTIEEKMEMLRLARLTDCLHWRGRNPSKCGCRLCDY